MPRPYPPEFKDQAIQRFVANRGDVLRTCRELGISERTLHRWNRNAGVVIAPPPPPPTPPTADSPPLYEVGRGPGGGDVLPPDDLQALRDLKARMLELAQYIVSDDRIKQAIDAAPLNQRIAAATQLIDRMIKLAAELPADEEEVEIINYGRGEIDEDDSTAGGPAQETADYFG